MPECHFYLVNLIEFNYCCNTQETIITFQYIDDDYSDEQPFVGVVVTVNDPCKMPVMVLRLQEGNNNAIANQNCYSELHSSSWIYLLILALTACCALWSPYLLPLLCVLLPHFSFPLFYW